LVHELQRSIAAALGENLLGLYLFGSLVLGDFDERRSDIDLLAITASTLSDDEFDSVRRLHDDFVQTHPEWDDRVEVAYMARSVLQRFRDKPGEVVRISPGEPIHRTTALAHWLTDLYAAQEQGLVLHGHPLRKLMDGRPISREEFVDAVRRSVPNWREWLTESPSQRFQAYARLTLCRSLYACRTGSQGSKHDAAVWLAQTYPAWSAVVDEALAWRAAGDDTDAGRRATADTRAFFEFVLRESR
jgi:predicted nucleotidyltransferase